MDFGVGHFDRVQIDVAFVHVVRADHDGRISLRQPSRKLRCRQACDRGIQRQPSTGKRTAIRVRVDTERHAASIERGRPGILHGARSYLLQDEDGQTIESHSISAGLDYPGVGPEHAFLADAGRAEYLPATDTEAMDALRLLSRTEGIIPAIESAHALAGALRLGRELGPDAIILVNLSGRGDKDVATAGSWFGLFDEGAVQS